MTYQVKTSRNFNKEFNLNREERKKTFSLPVQQAVLVPSTTEGDKPISKKEFQERIKSTERYLSEKFGGYTEVDASGGYYSTKKNKLIKEPVAVVTSFAEKKKFEENKGDLKKQLSKWKKDWKQESIGYEYENQLNYVGF